MEHLQAPRTQQVLGDPALKNNPNKQWSTAPCLFQEQNPLTSEESLLGLLNSSPSQASTSDTLSPYFGAEGSF